MTKSALFVAVGFVYSIAGLDARFRQQEDVMVVFYLCAQCLMAIPLFLMLPGFIAKAEVWPTLEREIRTGMYGPFAFWTVNGLISGVVSSWIAFFTLVLLFAVNDLSLRTLPSLWLLQWVYVALLETFCGLMSIYGREIGFLIFSTIVLHNIFNAGHLLDWEAVIYPFRAFGYIFPARLHLSATLNIVYSKSNDFEGAIRLSDASPAVLATPGAQAALHDNSDFYCPDSPDICYGVTGSEVLRSLHVRAVLPRRPSPLHPPFPSLDNRPPSSPSQRDIPLSRTARAAPPICKLTLPSQADHLTFRT